MRSKIILGSILAALLIIGIGLTQIGKINTNKEYNDLNTGAMGSDGRTEQKGNNETANNQEPTTTTKPASESPILKDMHESDITFDDKKINIYLFWGNGCSHCKALANFLESLDDRYKEYYDLYTFEVWYNPDNVTLMDKFSEKLNKKASGVPFYIIGSQSFSGFGLSMQEEIKQAIENEYNSATHTDVYREIMNYQ